MTNKRKLGMDWTAMLAASGLETPGYEEAVEATAKTVARRKQIEAERQAKKLKSKKRK